MSATFRAGSRAVRIAVLAAALSVLALTGTACSGGEKEKGGGPAGGAGPNGSQAELVAKHVEYAKCMRANGIKEFPDPQTDPGGGVGFSMNLDTDDPKYKAADGKCKSLLPAEPAANDPQARQDAVKLAGCMRSNGVSSFPDPDGNGTFHLKGVDREAPQYRTAMETCQKQTGFKGPMRVEN
ncbi:hypothetical protein [Actinomadura rudentiformis]|uniref:Lipoprotein n=1 Tax=Actinomadura rudentiformis TaxID=359158 RepID=A0A6H9YRH2_9ACTN|nr:hypothetical protein [Actinomadura rudentiformis]KAB2349138.1 hypothetical protein F8566_15560 [Actinomadura rudentiformis]